MAFKNDAYIRSLSSKEFPDLGSKLVEALNDLAQQIANGHQQGNFNGKGAPLPPPTVDGLTVKGQNGHFQIAISDNNRIYRGVRYYVEHSDNPAFTNPHVIALGDSRNHSIFLGNVTRYWRAYSAYIGSGPSSPVYHGGSASPLAVQGGGTVGGPAFLQGESSGTGTTGTGLSGPGRAPYRSVNGAPPVR